MSDTDVLLICESGKAQTESINLRLVELGQRLKAKGWCSAVKALIMSENSEVATKALDGYVDESYFMQSEALGNYNPEAYCDVVIDLIRSLNPKLVLLGNTFLGMDVASRLSSKLRSGLLTNCTDLEVDEKGLLCFQRPVYRSKLVATVKTPSDKTIVATIQSAEASPQRGPALAKSHRLEAPQPNFPRRIRALRLLEPDSSANDITKSDIVVAGGRGIGAKENFKLIEDLAAAMGGASAASRPLVDMGWVDKSIQVGMSGKTVKPKLYVACGISGAMEHLDGMKNSGMILAVNTDRNAPIFGIADFGIIGDLNEVVPELIKHAGEIADAVRG